MLADAFTPLTERDLFNLPRFRMAIRTELATSGPGGGRTDAGAAKQHRDTRRGRADPELSQLAFDRQVSPPGVLPRHLKDQLADLRIDRGAPGPAMRPRPLSRDE